MSDPGTPRSGRDPYANGYPTLIVRLIPGVYRYETAPKNLKDQKELIEYSAHRYAASGFSSCMVLGPQDGWFFNPGDQPRHTDQPPPSSHGLMLENGRMVTVENEKANDFVDALMNKWSRTGMEWR